MGGQRRGDASSEEAAAPPPTATPAPATEGEDRLAEAEFLVRCLLTSELLGREEIPALSPARLEADPGILPRFLLSSTWQEALYQDYVWYSEDGMRLYMTRGDAETLLDRVFGRENIPDSLWQSEDYDAEQQRFDFPTGIGLPNGLTPQDLTCAWEDGETVLVRLSLVEGANYGEPETLGVYEARFRALTVAGSPSLRFLSWRKA